MPSRPPPPPAGLLTTRVSPAPTTPSVPQTSPHCLLGTPWLCCEVQVCPAFRSHVSTPHMVRGRPPHSSNRALSSASRPVSPSSRQTPHRCSVTSHSTYPTLKSAASLLSPQSCSSSSAWIPSPWTAHHLLRCSGLQPGVTHHTPHGPDLLRVFDDHSPFHSLCLQSSTRSHHSILEPEQQVLRPLLHPAEESSLSGDDGADDSEVRIGSGRSFCPWKALRSQGPRVRAQTRQQAPRTLLPQFSPGHRHPRLPSPADPAQPALPAGFLHRTLSLLRLTPVLTVNVQEECRRVRGRALGQSGAVRAQQSRPPFGCVRHPCEGPHLPLLDGGVSTAEVI